MAEFTGLSVVAFTLMMLMLAGGLYVTFHHFTQAKPKKVRHGLSVRYRR